MKNFWSSAGLSQDDVANGQHYRDITPGRFGPTNTEWVVVDMFLAADGLRYVRLYRADDPTDRRTLSALAVADRRRFILA